MREESNAEQHWLRNAVIEGALNKADSVLGSEAVTGSVESGDEAWQVITPPDRVIAGRTEEGVVDDRFIEQLAEMVAIRRIGWPLILPITGVDCGEGVVDRRSDAEESPSCRIFISVSCLGEF